MRKGGCVKNVLTQPHSIHKEQEQHHLFGQQSCEWNKRRVQQVVDDPLLLIK